MDIFIRARLLTVRHAYLCSRSPAGEDASENKDFL
jgi:hypothetical protein